MKSNNEVSFGLLIVIVKKIKRYLIWLEYVVLQSSSGYLRNIVSTIDDFTYRPFVGSVAFVFLILCLLRIRWFFVSSVCEALSLTHTLSLSLSTLFLSMFYMKSNNGHMMEHAHLASYQNIKTPFVCCVSSWLFSNKRTKFSWLIWNIKFFQDKNKENN